MLSLQRFATSNNQVVAVGMISGVVMDASGGPVGTVLSGPGQIQVALSQSGTASAPAPGTSAPQSCGVLHMQFGTVTLSALAVAVTTSPVVIDLAGEANATDLLGPLVCQTLGALTNVGTLVESLNQLLAVLGILTGGSILPV